MDGDVPAGCHRHGRRLAGRAAARRRRRRASPRRRSRFDSSPTATTGCSPSRAAPGTDPADRRLGDSAESTSTSPRSLASTRSCGPPPPGCRSPSTRPACHEFGVGPRSTPITSWVGSRSTAGLWDFRLRVMVGGLTRTSPLRATDDDRRVRQAWVSGATARSGVLDRPVADARARRRRVDASAGRAGQSTRSVASRSAAARPRPARADRTTASTRAAAILLEPLDADAALIDCAAELRAGPGGSTDRGRVAVIARRERRTWRVWLRLGDAGSGAPIRLDIGLTRPARPGRLAHPR